MAKKRRTKKQKIAARKRQSWKAKQSPELRLKTELKPIIKSVKTKDNIKELDKIKLEEKAEGIVKDWWRTIWVSGVVLAGLVAAWWLLNN